MLLQLSLILIFVGFVLLLFTLRAQQRAGHARLEPIVDRAASRLRAAAKVDAKAQGLARLAEGALTGTAFQVMALHRVGAESAASRATRFLSARAEGLVSAAEAGGAEGFGRAVSELDCLRAARLAISAASSGAPSASAALMAELERLESASELQPGAATELALPSAAGQLPEPQLWEIMEAACVALEAPRRAIEPERLVAELPMALDAALLGLQASAPALETLGTPAPAGALEGFAAALGQRLLVAQTLTRLARAGDASAEERLLGSVGAAELVGVRESLAALSVWAGEVELDALSGGGKGTELREALAALAGVTRAEAAAAVDLVPASPRLTVQEMMLAHARGPALVERFDLACPGCLVADQETLQAASYVHDLPLEDLLAALEGRPLPSEPSSVAGDDAPTAPAGEAVDRASTAPVKPEAEADLAAEPAAGSASPSEGDAVEAPPEAAP